jgi:SAM-dependent methyltransferase
MCIKGYDYLVCNKCSFLFVSLIKSSTFDESEDEIKTDNELLSPLKRHYQIAQLLKNYFKETSSLKIAEVGAGIGRLGKLLVDNLLIHYEGFEPSKRRALFAQKHEISVTQGLFTYHEDSQYDAIILDNVLEHVENPVELLTSVSKSLREKGIVIIVVPNRFDIRRFFKLWRKRHYYQPECHINHFSAKNLQKVFTQCRLVYSDFRIRDIPSSFSFKSKMALYFKTLFDVVGLHMSGIYCFGIKKSS